jgi:ATP-dependent helicase/DNAse subunit B
MPLTLVLGPANSAKAGEVLGAYAAAAHRGALLVVPTAADAHYYGREVAGRGCVLGSVITFAGLAGEIAHRAGYPGRRLSAFQREWVLRRVVAEIPFEVLGESAASAGFATAAGNLISELQRSLVTPQRFAQTLEAWAVRDGRRRPYAGDLASLYRRYAKELERIGVTDADLHTWSALDALRAAPGRWGTDPVFFYGFDELTALERDAVETLARVVGTDVMVSLNYEPGRAAFAARAEAVEELRPLAQRVLELPALDEHYASGSRETLHHLERWLFEAAPTRLDPGEAVRLLEAGGARAEAELVAAEVLELLRADVPAEEIVVVCRAPLDAAPLLQRVFAQYGIPVVLGRRVPFTHTPLGRALLALARCAWLADAPADALLSYLRAPGVAAHPEVVDGLELEVRQLAVGTAEEARGGLGWALAEIDSLRAATAPSDELAWQARRLFAAPHRAGAAQLSAGEELDATALTTVLRALAELGELGETPSGPELLELLEELEVEQRADFRPGAVLIADPLGIRARRFRAVFVFGLQEGQFPLPAAPEPFLTDERRWELAAASGLALRSSEESLQRERYLFYACVSRATERLVLSYRSSDEEGNLELPSPFLADVTDLLVDGWPDRRKRRLLADVVWEPAAAPTPRELARTEAAALAPASGEPPVVAKVLTDTALRHVRHRSVVSAGALETFAGCPVRWLVEGELNPAQLDPDPDPLLRGGYIHRVLEELLLRLGGPLSPDSLPRAMALLDELLAELPAPVAPGRPAGLRAAARKSIEADLRRYVSHEAADGSTWPPQGLELRFGFSEEEESLPALTLGEGPDQVTVRGVIDRVDVDPGASGRAIVRDYKTGSVRPDYAGARWQEDRQLQVALYMIAVRRLLGVTPIAGLYQPLGGNDLRPRGVFLEGAPVPNTVVANDARTEEQLDEVLAEAAGRAVALAAQLRTGELEPCPQTCSRDGCRYPGICRSQ